MFRYKMEEVDFVICINLEGIVCLEKYFYIIIYVLVCKF